MDDDDFVSQPRLLSDLWAEPAARRALGFLAVQKIGAKLTAVRINALPVNEPGRDLRWLCFGPQSEIDVWRSTNVNSRSALVAIAQWLEGRFMSFGGAMAASFPLPDVYQAILERLDTRQQQVLRKRAAGDTLDAIGADLDVTRERIRQIEHGAISELALHIRGLRSIQHPIAQALFSHVSRLANDVVNAASREDGVLRDDTRRRWIRKTLSATEAECLLIFLALADDANPEAIEQFDPFLTAGRLFQGGRTTLSWNDEQVTALKRAFASLVGDRARRRADLHSVCAAAGLERNGVSALGRFANLTVHGEWVFEGRMKVADARRALISEILGSAGRAMHIAEIMSQALSLGMGSRSDLRDFQRAMTEDEDAFASDRAMWQLRAELGDVVEDRRPDNPVLPAPPSNSELMAALVSITGRTIGASLLLEGLAPGEMDFAKTAGERIATALGALPEGERRSVAQVLRPDDEATLIAWLGQAGLSDDFGSDSQPGEVVGGFPKPVLEGLTVLAAMVSVTRVTGSLDSGHWPGIFEACGEMARSWIFNTQQAPRAQVLALFVDVAFTMRLRQAFSFQSDPWAIMIGLQAGLLRNGLQPLPRWLGANQVPVAIRHLVTPGPNYSKSMACTWNTLQAYRRGHLGRDSVGIIS